MAKVKVNGMKKLTIISLILAILMVSVVIVACSSPGGFSIYLTKDDITVSEMEKLSHVEIADEPVISIDEIISYKKDTHEIELTTQAYERVMSLKVPTSGKSFMVCLDKAPIYWGAFWTPLSSQSFDGVTIWVPAFYDQENTVKLELGYPSPDFYRGEDPRSSPDIMESLAKAGKFK